MVICYPLTFDHRKESQDGGQNQKGLQRECWFSKESASSKEVQEVRDCATCRRVPLLSAILIDSVMSCSPYILFSISKMQELKHLCKNTKVTNFSSQISKQWRALSDEEKEKWRLLAEKDKLRYNAEKKNYSGPWVVRSDSARKVRLCEDRCYQ